MIPLFTLKIPGRHESLAVISAFIWAVAEDAGLDRRRAYRLRLAVDEIASNIIDHGYGDETIDTDPIYLWAEISETEVSITIEDNAPPFDPTQQPEPDDLNLPPEEREPGGYGVYLMMRVVDEVRYEYVNGHNVNRLSVRRVPVHDHE